MKNILLFTLIIFTLNSCKGYIKDKNNLQTTEVINIKIKNSEKEELFTPIKIVSLETQEECLIGGSIIQMEIFDSLIFIQDSYEQLYVFDSNGKFRTQIGKKGDGPDEYTVFNAFFLNKKENTISIIDDVKSSILKFDYNNNFISSFKLPLNSIRRSRQAILTENNKLLLFNMMNMEDNMAYTVLELNTPEKVEKKYSYDPIRLKDYFYSFSNHPMCQIGDDIHFIMPICDTVFQYSDQKFAPLYVIQTPQKLIPKKEFYDLDIPFANKVLELSKKDLFPGFSAIFETQNEILLNYKDKGFMLGYFIANKKEKLGSYHFYERKNKINSIPFFPIVYSFDNTFVGLANSSDILQLKDKISINSHVPFMTQFSNMAKYIKEDDNPILFFYEISK